MRHLIKKIAQLKPRKKRKKHQDLAHLITKAHLALSNCDVEEAIRLYSIIHEKYVTLPSDERAKVRKQVLAFFDEYKEKKPGMSHSEVKQ